MESDSRTLQDVDCILEYAKLDRSEFVSPVQCISFISELDNDSLKLLELDKSALHHLEAGKQLTIRGSKTDSAVLCTNDKTFKILEQDTSNALLVSSDLAMIDQLASEKEALVHRQVLAVKYEYYELREIKPRLKRLQNLLSENQYAGPECEEDPDHQGSKYTLPELLDLVQASEAELTTALHSLQACLIDGKWRMLDFDYITKVLTSILNLRDENSWSLDSIPFDDTCRTLSELYPREITCHILECFSDGQSDGVHRLSEDKVCRLFAEMILKPVEKFNLKEFEEVWQLAVPEGMKTGLYQLEGMALVDQDSRPAAVHYFPTSQLPEEVAERFNALFLTKSKWTRDEISPYIKDLAGDEAAAGALLTKYARASTQNGIKMYSSKKPVS